MLWFLLGLAMFTIGGVERSVCVEAAGGFGLCLHFLFLKTGLGGKTLVPVASFSLLRWMWWLGLCGILQPLPNFRVLRGIGGLAIGYLADDLCAARRDRFADAGAGPACRRPRRRSPMRSVTDLRRGRSFGVFRRLGVLPADADCWPWCGAGHPGAGVRLGWRSQR